MRRMLFPLAAIIVVAACATTPSNVHQPMVLSTYEPDYPENLPPNGSVVPQVIVEGMVGTDGVMREAHVIGMSDTRLEEEALQASEQFRFRPGTIDGVPTEMDYRITVTFRRRGRI